MPLEQATTISQLDEQWPSGGDSVDRGDDHIRLVKSVLKGTFPGPDGKGFSIPLTVDPAILNSLAATIKSLEDKITNAQAVGNIIFRDDNVDPATLYPGTTWVLLSGDACIALATADNAGTMSGSNTPIVPLPDHTHVITIHGVGDHAHSGNVGTGGASFEHHQYNGRMPSEAWQRSSAPAGAHTHGATINNAGTPGATLDVRGKRKYLCAWKRVK